jgi:hypothetical protein
MCVKISERARKLNAGLCYDCFHKAIRLVAKDILRGRKGTDTDGQG